jgi:hypothetical protein
MTRRRVSHPATPPAPHGAREEYDHLLMEVNQWLRYIEFCDRLIEGARGVKHRGTEARCRKTFNELFAQWHQAGNVVEQVARGKHRLTKKGLEIKARLEDVLYNLRDRRVRIAEQSAEAELRIAASETVCSFLLPLASQRFFANDPDVDLFIDVLSVEKIRHIESLVVEQVIDLAIAWKGYEWN